MSKSNSKPPSPADQQSDGFLKVSAGDRAELTRGVIDLVDKLASTTRADLAHRTMIANAKAGWSVGSVPPFGYSSELDVRTGTKNRKKLWIKDAEAVIVQRIFKLYLLGGAGGGAASPEAIASLLNDAGVSIRQKPFLASTISKTLRSPTYAGGTFLYNKMDSRTGKLGDSSEWVLVPVPPLVSQTDFDIVQARLTDSRP